MADEVNENIFLVNAPAGSGKTTWIRQQVESYLLRNPKDTEIVNLFPPKSGELSGINYISNLLWALEILAWSPEYLVHSISVLGLLEALPYERTNWTNTPINSIVSILLPWYPQTMADLEKRKNALKCLKTDNPRVFWSTLKKLLPNKTRSTSGNPRPKYLKLEIPEEVKVTNAEAHECYVYLVELAVDTARNKNEKLIELIDQLGYMYEPTLTDYLDCLENGFEFDTDENTFEVWIKLRECMARIEPTEGKVIYKQIDRIRQLTEKMEPTDIRVKHREWYLGNRYLFDKGNYANRWKMLEDKKLSAVKEIFDEYGSEEVERFGSAVKNVHDVANKLGHFLKPKEMSSIIEKCFIGILSKEFTINCLISFVYTQGAEKLLETSLCHMEDEFTLEILSKIPFSLQLLDVINQVLDDDTAYWEKAVMPYGCYEDETEALKIIVEKLVACKRYVTAVNIIGHSECEAVINAECIYKLMKLAGTEESIGVETLDDYAVQKIIGWFQQQEDIDLELRSDIEFIYLPMLDEYSEVRPRALNTRLSLESEYFCSLIELFYKERNGEKREIELNKSLSDRLYEILFQFKVTPGIDWNGNFDAKRFDYWMKTVKTWSRDNDRYEVAMHTVGSGLSYAELDEDKLPQTAVIEELNRVENEELRRGYYLGILDMHRSWRTAAGHIKDVELTNEIIFTKLVDWNESTDLYTLFLDIALLLIKSEDADVARTALAGVFATLRVEPGYINFIEKMWDSFHYRAKEWILMIYELLWDYREDFHDNMLTILKKHCEDEDFNVSLYSNLLLENYSSDDSFKYIEQRGEFVSV